MISRWLKPPKSIMAPKDIAPRISQTVESMLLMPPPEKSLLISGYGLSSTKPLPIATQMLLTAAKGALRLRSLAKAIRIGCCKIIATSAPASVPIRIERKAGYLRRPSSSKTTMGSRFHRLML